MCNTRPSAYFGGVPVYVRRGPVSPLPRVGERALAYGRTGQGNTCALDSAITDMPCLAKSLQLARVPQALCFAISDRKIGRFVELRRSLRSLPVTSIAFVRSGKPNHRVEPGGTVPS